MDKLAKKLTQFLGCEIKTEWLYEKGRRKWILAWLKEIFEWCDSDRKAKTASDLYRELKGVRA